MKKSVKSFNQCESQPDRMVIRAGVIQTIYDIVKAHGGELSCASKVDEGTQFVIKLLLD